MTGNTEAIGENRPLTLIDPRLLQKVGFGFVSELLW